MKHQRRQLFGSFGLEISDLFQASEFVFRTFVIALFLNRALAANLASFRQSMRSVLHFFAGGRGKLGVEVRFWAKNDKNGIFASA